MRRQTRAAATAEPVAQYLTALNNGDTAAPETVSPDDVVIYSPRAGGQMVTGTHAGFVDPSLPTAAHEWKRGRPPAPAAGNYWRTPVDDGPQLA